MICFLVISLTLGSYNFNHVLSIDMMTTAAVVIHQTSEDDHDHARKVGLLLA